MTLFLTCGLTIPLFHYHSSQSGGPVSDTVIAAIVTFFSTLVAFLAADFFERRARGNR